MNMRIKRGLDIVVLLHGDGQYAPEVMQQLLEPLETVQAEMVMGSRMLEAGAAGNNILHYTLHSDRQSSHQQIVQFVRRIGRAPVLDVGAAHGFLGQLLQHDHLPIDAVEPHPRWAAHARDYYRTVYASTIEHANLPAGHYPVVVCADVLEHTVDPVSVLNQMRATATEDALFIISLPNVAHIAARLLLLAGRFPQMERGIFDRTHLHFYTRATASADQ